MIEGGLPDFAQSIFSTIKIDSCEELVSLADSFQPQWAMINDDARAICLMCSRRAGKTEGLQWLVLKKAQETSGFRVLYIHHTREVAKQQFFEPLREKIKAKKIAETDHDETVVNVTFGRNCFVQVVGCDKEKEVGKKLGFKWDLIIIDECQEFKDAILVRLVDKTILPTLIDKGGRLILAGTPAEVEAGLWYKAIMGQYEEGGFRQHRWTLLENPHITRENIVETMAIRGFKIDFSNVDNNDILIQREIFGRQVIDPALLAYCYQRGELFNDWPVGGIPDVNSDQWRYAMGIDIGGANEGNDRDAVVVLGWMMNDPEHRLWEREAWEETELDSEEFCRRVLATYRRWRPMMAVCGDTGGAGANKALATVSNRAGGIDFTSKPTSVDLSMRLLNDEFRSGRLKINPLGLIARDAKICTKSETYHSDIMAALRYAHHCTYSYLAKAEKPKEKNPDKEHAERRRQAWREEQERNSNPWKQEGGWLI